LILTILNQIVF